VRTYPGGAADHGATWGRTLCGPMMVVAPASRAVVANRADAEGRLAARDGRRLEGRHRAGPRVGGRRRRCGRRLDAHPRAGLAARA
jgi:hypothetical protein